MIATITDDNFENEVLNSEIPCVIGFTAGWCNLCPKMIEELDALSKEYDGVVKFCSVNVDEQRKLRISFAVAAIPYTVFVHDKMKTPLFDELVSKERLDERIRFVLDGGKCPITVPIRKI